METLRWAMLVPIPCFAALLFTMVGYAVGVMMGVSIERDRKPRRKRRDSSSPEI